MVSEYLMFSRISGYTEKRIMEGWRELHNEESDNLASPSNATMMLACSHQGGYYTGACSIHEEDI
jgi:hypothetical protein